jgi:hypothetical protein
MDWFRWHHGTAADLKFTMVAKRSGQLRGIVLATWAYLLEYASTRDDRGSVAGVDTEEIACCLDITIDDVEQILSAMTEKNLISDDRLSGWEKRQPQREDDSNSERQRRYKEKQRLANIETQSNAEVTHGNAEVTQGNAPEKRREEKNIKPSPEISPASVPASLVNPKPKKPPAGDPRHAWLSRWWCWSFESVTGDRYVYGKIDAGIIATLLKKLDFPQTVERACKYLLMTDEQRFPRGAPTLTGLQYHINKLAGSFDEKTENLALAHRLLPPPGTPLPDYKPWEN